MKKGAAIILASCLVALWGCSGGAVNYSVNSNNQTVLQETAWEKPSYRLESTTEREEYTTEDGTLILSTSYELLCLAVDNEEAISPADRAAADQVAENFNEQMSARMDATRELHRGTMQDAQMAYDGGWAGEAYVDETSACAEVVGRVISVRLDNYSYYGGAHPNQYTVSLNFDLDTGRTIDPAQLADDPESFRTGVTKLLVEKADSMGEEYTSSYWSDYRDILARWNEAAVLFGESGMTVHYSPYEIGPYAMGELELVVGYNELEPMLGSGGMEKLGLTEQSAGQ